MRKYLDIINESLNSESFFGGKPVFVRGAPAYNPVVSHSPRIYVLYDENGIERASVIETMAQAPGAKFSSFSPKGVNSHERFEDAIAYAHHGANIDQVAQIIEWRNLSPQDKKIIVSKNDYGDQLQEGWKSAMGGAALAAAAITSFPPSTDYDDMTFQDAFAQAKKDKGEGETFKWKGKEYKIDMKQSKKFKPTLLRNDAGELLKYDNNGNLIPESQLQEHYENLLREEFERMEEGWKAALGAAAMGAAALTGLSGANNAAQQPEPTQLSSIQPMKFSAEAEKAAKQAGYQSAEAMYYFMKQQSKGATVEVDAFDRALSTAKGASMMHPANLLGYVADKMDKATKQAETTRQIKAMGSGLQSRSVSD